ncbi:MAG: hypothetical protein L3J56_10065, partial [Bacteroidales bacterium]|nr:hypothetical protein [Bacteroidales bacterium]
METILPVITFIVGTIAGFFLIRLFLKNTTVSKSEFENLTKEKEIAEYKLSTSEEISQKTENLLKEEKIQKELK